MASSLLLTLLLTFTIATTATAGSYKEKTTNLHFYFHEIFSGPNATIGIVVPPLSKSSIFGQLGVIDDFLRSGPKTTSKIIGRAQGLVVGSSIEGPGILTAINFVFTDGEYNGSTLAIFGQLNVGDQTFERSIIGGTGKFRLARGYTTYRMVTSPPPPTGSVVIEVNAVVLHH